MIKIGIIDSGLNCTTAGIASDKVTGKSFGQKSLGDTALNAHNFTDQLGHGTHCACIIAQAVPHAQYYIAKIFQHNLSSDVETLVAALYWCIEQQVDLVNISLGIRSKIMHPGLQRACDLAYEQGIVLIAAANNDNQICFPAYYHKVLGVGHAALTGGADFIWVADSAIECYTTPPPLQNTLTHTNSTSFCCPVISGWAAKYMLDEGLRGPAAIRERLARAGGAQHKYYLPLHPAHGYTSPADFEPTKLRGIAQRYLAACGMLEPLGRIRLAPLNDLAFSFMEGLAPVMSQPLRCTGNFSLSSKGQLDAAFSNPNLEDSFDTIALGQLAYYLDGNNETLFTDGLERLLHHKKKFLVFDDSSAAIIQKKASEIGVESFVHQQVFDQRLYHDFRQFRFLPAITTPILAITGTGYQEVVSLQLYLKDFLTANGIRTACISPALQGNLMGADFALPLVFNDSSKLTSLQLCNMVSDAVKALQFFCQPQLIIAGTVNAVLPPFDSDGFGWADNVALLQSLQPDALLCVIEADVEKEKIQKNLAALYANTHCPILLQASQLATLQSYEPFANNLFSEYRLTTLNDKEDWQNLLGWVNHIIHQSTPS